jgi:hypothetical protein
MGVPRPTPTYLIRSRARSGGRRLQVGFAASGQQDGPTPALTGHDESAALSGAAAATRRPVACPQPAAT